MQAERTTVLYAGPRYGQEDSIICSAAIYGDGFNFCTRTEYVADTQFFLKTFVKKKYC